jgi:hypothetical protein
MKFKALRTKREPKEFVQIDYHNGEYVVYTHDLPNPQPMTATMELMKAYYDQQKEPLPDTINLDDYELIEMDCIESGVVGADIRNKLTPLLNLIALIDIYIKDEQPEKKSAIRSLIIKEMGTSKICIKYLVKLL